MPNFELVNHPTTYPNQRMVKIHRQRATSDFLGIKNQNWMAASRNLRPHALLLYMYLAANADNYNLALSPTAIHQEIGMPRSTYHDQFHILVNKGYLVHNHGNTFDFYEVPQTRDDKQEESSVLRNGLDFENDTVVNISYSNDGQDIPQSNTEINNIENSEKYIADKYEAFPKPKVEEIHISVPKAQGKNRPAYSNHTEVKTGEFIF